MTWRSCDPLPAITGRVVGLSCADAQGPIGLEMKLDRSVAWHGQGPGQQGALAIEQEAGRACRDLERRRRGVRTTIVHREQIIVVTSYVLAFWEQHRGADRDDVAWGYAPAHRCASGRAGAGMAWRKTMMVAGALAALMAVGCSSAPTPPPEGPPLLPPEDRPAAIATAEERFAQALATLARRDRGKPWTEQACRQVAADFAAAAGKLEAAGDERAAMAHYNRALALGRCQLRAEAQPIVEALVAAQPGFHRARVQLAMARLAAAGPAGLDQAIAELSRVVRDADYQNVEALVFLAQLQMRRGKAARHDQAGDDLDRAKLNLQRALAIDDRFMPALNQLAIYYVRQATASGGGRLGHLATAGQGSGKVDRAMLELAALVCAQAIRKDSRYAPIHNTAGLVYAELGDQSAAAQFFAKAWDIDPRFFEAHMNYGAINLRYRGFANAERAYRASLALRPDDYDARLGLALAYRGQIRQGNTEQMVAAATRQLHAAKRLDAKRPEAYFNEAILVKEFRANGGLRAKPMLLRARGLFEAFVSRAEDERGFDDAVAQARERMADIDRILDFLGQTVGSQGKP